MYQRILAVFDGTHEARLAIEEAAALARAFNGRVRVVWATGSPAIPESREIYSIDKLREEVHRTVSVLLVELQRQFDAGGTPAETGVLMFDATNDDIGSTLEHEAKCWQADTTVVGSQGKHGLTRLLLGSMAE